MEKERCDNQKEVFNARVNEDEMIIAIEEYESLKKTIDYLKEKDKEYFELRQRVREENIELNRQNSQLKKENIALKKENIALKRGIINFVNIIGGTKND